MSTIGQRIRAIEPGALIVLWEALTTGLGAPQDVYFYNPTDPAAPTLHFQGKSYDPWPIKGENYETSSKGVLPRPTVSLGNITSYVSALCRAYGDLVGCEVVRRRTLYEYLDDQPGADPTQELIPEKFVVNRKVSETNIQVDFELATKLEVEGVLLPRRQMLANACQWLYRGDDCGWAGNAVADEEDDPLGAHFTDGITDGSVVFTSATANFTSADYTRMIFSDGTSIPRDTGIAKINSPTSVNLTRAVAAHNPILFTIAGRTTARGLYNPVTVYAAGDQTYTLVNGIRFYWFSLVNGNTFPLSNPTKWTLDRCGKRLHSCKMRFGPNSPLRTSAFPGIDKLS